MTSVVVDVGAAVFVLAVVVVGEADVVGVVAVVVSTVVVVD